MIAGKKQLVARKTRYWAIKEEYLHVNIYGRSFGHHFNLLLTLLNSDAEVCHLQQVSQECIGNKMDDIVAANN